MALKLSDCPPSLHAAILAQLEKEGRQLPTTTVHYAMAHQIGGKWRVGPETENLDLIKKQVSRMQTQSGRAAYLCSIGQPTAVVIKLTRTTQPTAAKGGA